MLIEQKFGNSILGGFKKESVLNYLEKLSKEHSEDLKALEDSYNEKISYLNDLLKQKQVLCDKYKKELETLKSEIADRKKGIGAIVGEKQLLLDKQDETILNMGNKIKQLEMELDKLKSSEELEENRIKRAEYIAKERVSQIIKRGKAKILEEYKEQIDHCKEEKDLIKKKAFKEASNILSTAASRIFSYNTKVNDEIKKLSFNVKQRAKDIINEAKSLAEQILKDSFQRACRNSVSVDFEEFKIGEDFDVNYLNKRVDEEILNATEKLKNLDLFGQKELSKELTKDRSQKKPKKVVLDVVNKKNKF